MSRSNANEAREAPTSITSGANTLVTVTATATDSISVPSNIVAASGTYVNPGYTYVYTGIAPGDSSTAVPAATNTPGVSVAVKVAIGVSIPVVALALLFGIIFFFRRRKQKIIQRESQRPQYELGFSPAPSQLTFGDKKLAGSTLDGRSNTRNSSRMEKSRSESRTTNRSAGRLESRFSSHNSLAKYRSPSMHIAELGSPTDIAPAERTIYEIGPGKEVEPEVDSDTEIEFASVVELPDTSRRSVKNWGRPRRLSVGSTTSKASKASRDSMPTTPGRVHRSTLVRDTIPERPAYDGEGYDEEVNISWLAPPEVTTPRSSRFYRR
ncbi:hypothetical protein BGZ60DRAFT_430353 [Tricladium varicosporioides]|nr:hypothetical protein BGZ60DRAFT_430353 [Hymenoscyphus varicosporioides]